MSSLIAGVDEAGRGPLAGPVVAAAVILPKRHGIQGLNDSKKLSEKKREALFDLITDRATSYAIAEASVEEIDKLNILHASMLAMKRSVEQLIPIPEMVLVDGNRCPDLNISCQAIVGGDALEPSISAASILAKVTRDRLMVEMNQIYPGYGFAVHKGYPTKLHRECLVALGSCPIHRQSYRPVQQADLFKSD